jgi:hypothetical protein
MSAPFSDLPGLLANGIHDLTLERLAEIGVANFPLSQRRPLIMEGFRQVFQMFREQAIAGDVIVDGSFLTEVIEPKDMDFSLCVSPEFYEGSSPSQRKLMDWISDDKAIKDNYLCDCYLCVEYPPEHEQYFDGIQNRLYWTNLYRFSAVLRRERGIGVIHL